MYAHKVLTIAEALAQIINDHKKDSGLTWEQIADKSGLKVLALKRMAWRAGKRNTKRPQLEPLVKLAGVFGADAGAWIDEAKRRVKESN